MYTKKNIITSIIISAGTEARYYVIENMMMIDILSMKRDDC